MVGLTFVARARVTRPQVPGILQVAVGAFSRVIMLARAAVRAHVLHASHPTLTVVSPCLRPGRRAFALAHVLIFARVLTSGARFRFVAIPVPAVWVKAAALAP